jgi:hypothetical protein
MPSPINFSLIFCIFIRRMEMILKILAFGPGFRPPSDPTADPELSVLANFSL